MNYTVTDSRFFLLTSHSLGLFKFNSIQKQTYLKLCGKHTITHSNIKQHDITYWSYCVILTFVVHIYVTDFFKWWIYSQEGTAKLIGVMHEIQHCCYHCIKHDIFVKELRSISSVKSHVIADVFLQAKQLVLYSLNNKIYKGSCLLISST
jgi:hypothetical protein